MTKKLKPETKTVKPETKKAYEQLYERPLSNQEVFEANHNLTGFFNVLLKIDKRVSQNLAKP